MHPRCLLLALLTLLLKLSLSSIAGEEWRSGLYPADWKPGYADEKGHFLHDFSYAGYHRGERSLPDRKDNVIDVTQPPYGADSTGNNDATVAIQSALDTAGKAGGGVVFLPPGTYRVSPPADSSAALKIQYGNVVLRGAGAGKTFLSNDSIQMRDKRVIEIKPSKPAAKDSKLHGASSLITQDLPHPTDRIPVADASAFAVDDLVVVRSDHTQHFIDLLGMTGKWTPGESPNRTLTYYRRIARVEDGFLTLDIPVRGFLFTADNARVMHYPGRMITEVGLENFSIGMKQHPGGKWYISADGTILADSKDNPSVLDDTESKNTTPGTTAYDIHSAIAVYFGDAENCWVRRVNSYAPPGNDPDVHILSHGIVLSRTSRLVTVEECEWRFPQYLGGGGNGYLYMVHGSDCLIRNCSAEGGRHNYSFGTMSCTGNVITNLHAKNGRLACDFHMFFSLANLLDNITCEGDYLEAQYRPYGGNPQHGVTTTESVFWNTNGLRYPPDRNVYAGKAWDRKPSLIVSKQFGDGYVIGTRGPASRVKSTNYVEGIGKGDALVPRSLYADQLTRRLQREPGERGK